MLGKKGMWVQIREIVLTPGERAPQVPEDTKQTPLVMWVKGHLNDDAYIGGPCTVTTATGRTVKGILEETEPSYTHNFGKYIPETDEVRRTVKELLGVL